jgi:hypothetical protein
MRIDIRKSTNPNKKMMAVFYDGYGSDKKIKTVHFGQYGASDYTIHRDDERKQLYLDRHKKNENWNDPMTAGSLSRYILWNKPTLEASIRDYKKRFNL